ncbi:MAG: sugar-transfer associated ATP-grasp domain-containing protein, partial [Oceanospirillum sp.]|nr:sugar-transfer associated ATP-grasp domain-containing protein [Oceanospirillum sp.]
RIGTQTGLVAEYPHRPPLPPRLRKPLQPRLQTRRQQIVGGVGVRGKAVRAVQFDHPVSHHPDTQRPLDQLVIPDWEQLLVLAASAWEMTGLGYIGTDMVIDKSRGPMVLELNARPGLAIQTANGTGLLPRLQKIESLRQQGISHTTPEERVAVSRELFARQTEAKANACTT